MKAVLFDLDDTLYPESEFVKSGFNVAARYLCSRFHFGEEFLLERMYAILQRDGRGRVFDSLLRELDLYSEEKTRVLVYLYRSHYPSIHLYEDVLSALGHLRRLNLRLAIVTDGMASVQRNKIAALGLDSLFDVVVCTDELGRNCWKPSNTPYEVALKLLDVSPRDAVYIGDNPVKDFIGPNMMGLLSIQVKRNNFGCSTPIITSEKARAEIVVGTVLEILPVLEEKCCAY